MAFLRLWYRLWYVSQCEMNTVLNTILSWKRDTMLSWALVFQSQIDPVQNRGTFLWAVISKTCHWIIRSNKVLLYKISNISVPCPHAQLRGQTVIKKLWTFFGPWGRDRAQSPPCWIFRVKLIHQSTASERTTRLSPENHTTCETWYNVGLTCSIDVYWRQILTSIISLKWLI